MAACQEVLLHMSDYHTSRWSGGTTTELAIAPQGSVYGERDFLWRLSSATVELEESTFTPLADYDRILMTLKGGIQLSHNQGNWISLAEFEPHAFDGADETVSIGKVTDFNLMLRKDRCRGFLLPLRMEKGETLDLRGALAFDMPEYEELLIYCYQGELTVTAEAGRSFYLQKGDTLKLSGELKEKNWFCKANQHTLAVISTIHYC